MEKPHDLIRAAMINRVASLNLAKGGENPFFVADLGQVYRQHIRWKRNLASVQPFYAVKCNSDDLLLKLLAAMGTGFDCASVREIELILNLGVDPSRIIFANPCKAASSITFARSRGIRKMTFDNKDELYKIRGLHPEAKLLLRIFADDKSSLCRLGQKFGAKLDSTIQLLRLAQVLKLEVVGVSFHIGSGASNVDVLQDAVKHARIVYKQAAEIGHRLSILDVGGGFQDKSFEKMARSLTESLRAHFPPSVNIIAEPGRFYASSAFSLVTNVIARRNSDKRSAHTMIYQSDGIYGNFMNVIIEKAAMVPELLITDGYDRGSKKYKYSIWGPTCDGVDRINPSCTLKCQIKVGDWLYYHNMGAYTSSCTTGFNGFDKIHDVIYVCSEPDAADLVAIPLMDQGFLTTKLSLEGLV